MDTNVRSSGSAPYPISVFQCFSVLYFTLVYCAALWKACVLKMCCLNQVNWITGFLGKFSPCTVSISCLQSYEEERRIRTDLELRCQRLTLELADTKQHIQEGDYRRDNYPSIKRFVCVWLLTREKLFPFGFFLLTDHPICESDTKGWKPDWFHLCQSSQCCSGTIDYPKSTITYWGCDCKITRRVLPSAFTIGIYCLSSPAND